MGLVNENLKACGVKIEVNVNGVRSFGSGVVYETPNYCNYNYVLTAKHIFQEDSRTDFSYNNISDLTISYNEKDKLKKLQHIKRIELNNKLIVFEEDLIIIIINKNPAINFRQILVTDDLTEEDNKFTSWAIFSGNEDEINKFTFERYDPELRRLKLVHSPSIDLLPGISGGGVFIENKYILYGIVSRYPNNNFELETVDCVKIDFKLINEKLKQLNRIQLDTKSSSYKREIQQSVVDIHQAFINGVCLNLESARKRLKHDIIDDWYHDPLQYIDLCNQDYLFKEFELYFNSENYKASEAEFFYIPKKQYTLRQALISPFIDRIIYMAVVGVLAEKIENSMIPYVYSARYNKYNENSLIINGVEQWKKMQYAMSEKSLTKDNNDVYKYQYILEVDLLNYYDNINKKLLIEKINRICETPNETNAAELLNKILFNFSNKDSGLPQNSDASSLLATFYLNQVDLYMHNRTFAYYRFMDDIRIFCTDKYEARKILQELEYELRRCYLSVNSQKTKILLLDDQNLKTINNDYIINRSKFRDIYNLELNKISRLRKTNNYAYLNESFHESIKLLENYINNDTANEEGSKELNYALNTLEYLGRKDINIYHQDTKFEKLMITITHELIDKPWITNSICRVLNLMQRDFINNKLRVCLENIIINNGTYAFQTYQIWMLFAKHKIKSNELIRYATINIEKNDETNKPVIAAMIIYLCSVEYNYSRVILRKFKEGFTLGYFQNRVTLIALRRFSPELIPITKVHNTLKSAHSFTYLYKNKDLVYANGFNENNDPDNQIEQLYSI